MPRNSSEDTPLAAAAGALSERQQNRNLVRFAVHVGVIYLAAPVAYVGNLDAVLLNKLGFSDKVANLPIAAYSWTTAAFLVLFTWYFCQVRVLKPALVTAYAVSAMSGLFVIVGLVQSQSTVLVVAMVVRATLLGWFLGVVGLFEWEVLARGVPEHRRGLALSLAYGLGPILAVVSSLGTQLVLDGKLGPISPGKLDFPWDFLTLFLVGHLIMAVPAFSATRYVVPAPRVEVAREPLLAGVFGGFGEFLKNRLLMSASIALLLMIFGYAILPNVVLYTKEALGEPPQNYAGYQLALRFTFKATSGMLLGWMLVRTHQRAGLVTTTSFCLIGVLWALVVPGKWYLLSFGILGAGELYYVYYQNYLVSSSPPSKVRRNLAYASLLALPMTLAPVIYGLISDNYGLRVSIAVAAAVLACALLVVQLALPRRPSVRRLEGDPLDTSQDSHSQVEVICHGTSQAEVGR